MSVDMRSRLLEIFADVFDITPEPGIEDLSPATVATWDSMNKMRLVLEIEQVFGVALSDEEVIELTSLRAAEAMLARRGANGARG